jgi:STE24 endopeptidase
MRTQREATVGAEEMMRVLSLLVCALALAPSAHAAPAFDPAAATAAWIETIGADALARSNAYFEGGYWLTLAAAAATTLVSWIMLHFRWASGVRTGLERTVKLKTLTAFGMGLFYLAVSTALTFPLTVYVAFFREHAYGLSTQTFPAWFSEYLIDFALTLVLGGIFIALLYLIVRWTKALWWLWGAGATIVLMAALIALSPIYIAPLFNDYQPMAEGELKNDILALAQANGVPAENVYVFDVSRQTNRITANVSGMFGTTRISLSDTLLERSSPEAVKAVMGHEIGHYVLRHLNSILLMLAVLIAAVFALVHVSFARLSKNERWGVRDIADPAGLPLVAALATLFFTLAAPLNNNIIRFHEHQADIFGLNAARAPDGFAEAAVMLSEYRKMQPGPLEEWAFYDHPSGYTRIHMAMQWKAHEIGAGRLPPSRGGPPEGWRPDFVVMREQERSPAPATSPAAASD